MDNELAIRIAALAAASEAVSEYTSVIHRAELYATWLRKGLDEGSEELAQAEAALVTNPCAYDAQRAVQAPAPCEVCKHVHKATVCGYDRISGTAWGCYCGHVPLPASRNGDDR